MKKKFIITIPLVLLTFHFALLTSPQAFAALPSSSNYQIQDYSFGAGGTTNSTSTNYKLNGVAGEVEFGRQASANFKNGSGLTYLMKSNVPPAPTFTNPGGYYNKLQIQLSTGSNPADAQFAIALQNSSDSFVSTQYVQADDTLGSSPVWQTSSTWGTSPFYIISLLPGLTYHASVAARQGSFTQSEYGPTASAATTNPSFSFSVSPSSITNWNLTPNTIGTSSTVTVNLATNAASGGTVYVKDTNTGLTSTTQSHTISSVSNDLTAVGEGYGAQKTSVTQTTGGPIEAVAPYNTTGTTVGILSQNANRVLFDSTSQPVTGGVGTFTLLAKPSVTAPPAADYSDLLTIIGAANF